MLVVRPRASWALALLAAWLALHRLVADVNLLYARAAFDGRTKPCATLGREAVALSGDADRAVRESTVARDVLERRGEPRCLLVVGAKLEAEKGDNVVPVADARVPAGRRREHSLRDWGQGSGAERGTAACGAATSGAAERGGSMEARIVVAVGSWRSRFMAVGLRSVAMACGRLAVGWRLAGA